MSALSERDSFLAAHPAQCENPECEEQCGECWRRAENQAWKRTEWEMGSDE